MKLFNNKIVAKLKILRTNRFLESVSKFGEDRARKITTLSFTLLALSIFGLFAVSPTLSTIAGLRKQLDDDRFVDERLKEKIANLSSLYQKYSEIQPDIPFILSAVPNTPETTSLVGSIQTIGTNSNVSVTSIQTFQVEAASPKTIRNGSFNFAVSAEGSYDNLILFLTSISNFQRIVSFDNIAINRKTGEGEILQLDIRGTAYFKP